MQMMNDIDSFLAQSEPTGIVSYRTTYYERFELIKGNRSTDLTSTVGRELATSIRDNNGNFISILVTVNEKTGKLRIVDGQHRYAACVQENVPVMFSIIPDEMRKGLTDETLMMELNKSGNPWKLPDFMNFHAVHNSILEYKVLLQYAADEVTQAKKDNQAEVDRLNRIRLDQPASTVEIRPFALPLLSIITLAGLSQEKAKLGKKIFLSGAIKQRIKDTKAIVNIYIDNLKNPMNTTMEARAITLFHKTYPSTDFKNIIKNMSKTLTVVPANTVVDVANDLVDAYNLTAKTKLPKITHNKKTSVVTNLGPTSAAILQTV